MITDFSALISTAVKIGQFQTINESKMSILNCHVHHIIDRALLAQNRYDIMIYWIENILIKLLTKF